MLLKTFYNVTLNAKVPFFNQKYHSGCLRDSKLRFMPKNGQKMAIFDVFRGSPLLGAKKSLSQNFFKSCLATAHWAWGTVFPPKMASKGLKLPKYRFLACFPIFP